MLRNINALGASAYQSLYSNVDGLADAFGQFWAKVATTFGNTSSVIGVGIISSVFVIITSVILSTICNSLCTAHIATPCVFI